MRALHGTRLTLFSSALPTPAPHCTAKSRARPPCPPPSSPVLLHGHAELRWHARQLHRHSFRRRRLWRACPARLSARTPLPRRLDRLLAVLVPHVRPLQGLDFCTRGQHRRSAGPPYEWRELSSRHARHAARSAGDEGGSANCDSRAASPDTLATPPGRWGRAGRRACAWKLAPLLRQVRQTRSPVRRGRHGAERPRAPLARLRTRRLPPVRHLGSR